MTTEGIDSVFSFLSIGGEQKLVGSAGDPKVLYSADYDLLEYSYFPKGSNIFILDLFRMKYSSQSKFNLIITDFKCGTFRGQPVRWDSASIAKGYTILEDNLIYFVDCLQMKSRIKMDVIANGTEYSSIYIIHIGDYSTYYKESKNIILKSLYSDYLKYRDYNIFKAFKRVYSYFKLKRNFKQAEKILLILNSYLGKEYQKISRLETKLKLMKIKRKANSKIQSLEKEIGILINKLNEHVILFIEKEGIKFK